MLKFKKFCIAFIAVLIFGIIFGWIIFPTVMEFLIRKRINLAKGSEVRKNWEKTPFPVRFLIRVFNITNPEEFQKGKKLIVKEVGPYYFDEWKSKHNLEDNDDEDSVSYNMKTTFIFRPDKSGGLTGEEPITLPDVLFLSMAIYAKREFPYLFNFIKNSMKKHFPDSNVTLTANFLDIFFRGVPVKCSNDSILLCGKLIDKKIILPINDTHSIYSLFGAKNDSVSEQFTSCRGIKNSQKLGKVIRYKNQTKLNIWYGDMCNELRGTDTTISPPFMKPEDGLWSFTPDTCRSMGAVHIGESICDGIPCSKYYFDMGDIKADENLHCFCHKNSSSECPPKGTMDLTSCLEAPLFLSMPHFYNGDSKLFKNIKGLEPKKEKHAVFVDFERITGTPLQAFKRIQFNLEVDKINEFERMKNLKKIIVPLFWIEESVKLNSKYVDNLKYSVFFSILFNDIIKWLCVVIGGIGALLTGYFIHNNQSGRANVNEQESS